MLSLPLAGAAHTPSQALAGPQKSPSQAPGPTKGHRNLAWGPAQVCMYLALSIWDLGWGHGPLDTIAVGLPHPHEP